MLQFIFVSPLPLYRPPPVKSFKIHRVLKIIDNDSLKDSVCSSLKDLQSFDDVNVICQAYNTALSNAVDEHAPHCT